ncbi:MAG: phosphohydrolase [Herpetosiphonaceae bacterium]|nr:MAG: phosphohydrolase [Herpetosiphonaceae bacterium]
MGSYSQRFEDALVLAATAHRNQLRKGSNTPYITHPVHVARILTHYGYDEDIVIAGLLHDVIEDCDLQPQEIAGRFGLYVAEIVVAISEQKRAAGGEIPWEERKANQLAALRDAPIEAVVVKAADTLHNLLATYADVEREGEIVWQRFKRGRGPSMAHHRAVVATIEERMGDHPLVHELKQALKALDQTTQSPSSSQ